ncbi:MAG: cupredoxin domain-containing protein [Pseudomonadales bacterium]
MRYSNIPVGMMMLVISWTAAADATVEVGHNRLEPAQVTIQAGESVTFHNQDRMPGGHTIVADDGGFSSPPLEQDGSWSHTFDSAGSYPYHIKEHSGATGTVTVE